MSAKEIKFRNEGDEILTLYVEKTIGDPQIGDEYIIGWCPELKNSMVVHPENVVVLS